ncbi:MAG: thioredoxin family protein [Limisphaerales bacterium]
MKQITGAEFESEVLGSKEPVLVDFYTDTCPPCRMMAPVLQEMENESNGQYKVVKIDAGAELQLTSSFRVNSVPAFFVFANGKCVGQTIGAKSKNHMKKWLEDSIRSA